MTTIIKSTQVSHAGVGLDVILGNASFAPIDFSAVYDPPSIAASGTTSQAFTVAGAAMGDWIQSSFNQSLGGCILSAYVSATNEVTAVLHNPTAGSVNINSGTIKFRLTRSA